MKKIIIAASAAILLVLTSGCANGPLRQWIQGRGAACNTCQPPVGQPPQLSSGISTLCESGNCGSGAIGSGIGGLGQGGPIIEAPAGGVPLYSDPALAAPTNNLVPGNNILPGIQPTNTQYPDFGGVPADPFAGGLPSDLSLEGIQGVPSAPVYSGSAAGEIVPPPSIGNWPNG